MGQIFDIHLAKAYDNWCKSPRGLRMEQFLEHMVSGTLKPFRQERVIDIGCGSGNHLLMADRMGMNISGIDASPYMLSLAKERLGNRCELKKAYAEDLPYEDNTFDVAFLINTLEFLSDPLPVLEEAGRVAKRGIFIAVFNSTSRHCRWQKLCGNFSSNLFSNLKMYTLWELKRLINRVYGSAPVTWQSGYLLPRFVEKMGMPFVFQKIRMPFGILIGITITLKYRFRTDNIFLKEKLSRRKGPAIEGVHISHSK